MDITYDSICKKLGYDPLKDFQKHKNDSTESPFNVLNTEEIIFLGKYMEDFLKTGNIN